MVTKHRWGGEVRYDSSVLAKILMVTKLPSLQSLETLSSVLAKILMVTKPCCTVKQSFLSSVLAKILMVTKQQ